MITQLDKTQLEGKGWVFSSKEVPDPSLQSKEVTFTENGTTELVPDEGFTGLSSVTATVALPLEDKNVTITKNGEYVLSPSEGYEALSSVTAAVNVPNVDPEGLWQRPLDRPVKPEMQDNEVRWLFGVKKGSPNDFGVTIKATSSILMDWGNGVTTTHSSGSLISYKYTDFDQLPQKENYAGYKYVWIVARPATPDGSITEVNINTKPLWRDKEATFIPNVFEFYVQCPQLSSLICYPQRGYTDHWYGLCDIFGLGRNQIARDGIDYLCKSFYSLQRFDGLDIENIPGTINNFMSDCISFNGEFPDTLTFKNLGSDAFSKCYVFTRAFGGNVTFASVSGYVFSFSAYNGVFTTDRKGATVKDINLSFSRCYSLTGLRIKNAGSPSSVVIDLSRTSLEREALVNLFNDLPATGATRLVTLDYCLGVTQLTAEDRKIATDKGYTIRG